MNEKLNRALEKMRNLFASQEKSWDDQCDQMWSALDEQQRQAMFYSVMKRVYQHRVQEGRGYRGTLYDGFGFGPSAYSMGMSCNFFDLHNMLHDAQQLEAMKGVTRFEVIDRDGRSYVKYLDEDEGIKYSLQDDDQTLKVFIDTDSWRGEW